MRPAAQKTCDAQRSQPRAALQKDDLPERPKSAHSATSQS